MQQKHSLQSFYAASCRFASLPASANDSNENANKMHFCFCDIVSLDDYIIQQPVGNKQEWNG